MSEFWCGVCTEAKGYAAACMLCLVWSMFEEDHLSGWE